MRSRSPPASRSNALSTCRCRCPCSRTRGSTDWAYRSRINFFLYESREYRDNHLLEGGTRLAWVSASGGLEVAAFGRNILNDTSPTGGLDFNNLTGFVNEPPVWSIKVAVRF